MSRSADIGGKRLISLAPTAWARWVTGDPTVEVVELVGQEFQWVARANDVLIKVQSSTHGAFLVANELQLRADRRIPRRIRAYSESIAELEPLLAFFASFVLSTEIVQRVMRWDMEILRESPWYNELIKEGIEQGIEQGREEGIEQERFASLVRVLSHRFGALPDALVARLHGLTPAAMMPAMNQALDATTLAEFDAALDQLLAAQQDESFRYE